MDLRDTTRHPELTFTLRVLFCFPDGGNENSKHPKNVYCLFSLTNEKYHVRIW